jgi:hypothetical protein
MARIAIASDLHCHRPDSGEPAASFLTTGLPKVPWKVNPVEALKRRIAASNLSAEILLCPGDLGNRCSPEGMAAAWEAIQEIGEALGTRRVVATIGNHDVDSRRLIGKDPFAPARCIAATFPLGSDQDSRDFWNRHFRILDWKDLRLLVLNSVASHTSEAEAKHGAVAPATMEEIEDALRVNPGPALRVAVVHHHPHPHEDLNLGAGDLMHGGQGLLDLLNRNAFSLVVHGHKHHPKVSYAQGGTTTLAVFAAGSLTHINHAELASNTRNLFHIVEVEPTNLSHCTVAGTIRSWEFNCGSGWNPATRRSAGFPVIAGFGCRRPHRDLVAAVIPHVAGSVRRWDDLEAVIPELRYLLPQDKGAVLKLLEEAGVQVLYGEDGEPEMLTTVRAPGDLA